MTEQVKRVRKLLAEKFGITTDAELIKAAEENEVDLGIFVTPYKGGQDEEKNSRRLENWSKGSRVRCDDVPVGAV